MRIRRNLAAVVAAAALAGLGLAGAATAATAALAQGAPTTVTVVTPSECRQGGGTPAINDAGDYCNGGMYDGEKVD
ncbi:MULTISPECIES: hypothetical protein [Streptomyces]|uniref:Chaplin domain-containing protein n=1 Tax=Streptomyces katrae TaxID=68223 RepID=A0ABT7H7F6_9ACTN|nr:MULTISPECIES: hypothetical protein [Streptomyces]MDK9501004.1 hypothetical protein [Streptomyces katrae]GLX18266.1 hypothetical protein Slala01_19100 [Streptomyces lavendulae subsp. lavendulae]GLX28808.1 hypothetical protein Slala02_46280 [Streptomyces lavendulae subsp. lavendulae]